MKTQRAVVAEIALGTLKDNLQEVRRRTAGCRVLAVVKSNAYGHGILPVARALEVAGVEMLGVALVEEGGLLREGGIRAPILVMGGIFPEQIPDLLQWRLIPAVSDLDLLSHLDRAARLRERLLPIHVKIDTGMGRLGMPLEQLPRLMEILGRCSHLRLEGVMTHFAAADHPDLGFTREQLNRFREAWERLRQAGISPGIRHAANSAAILRLPEAHLDMVRPGLLLYGYSPFPDEEAPVTPVLTLKTRIVLLKQVPAGTPLSYGRTFVTRRPSRIAVLPVGYADGYPRSLSNRGVVLVRGHQAPVVGRVCMDMMLVDVTDIPGVRCGDVVTLIGQEGDAFLGAHELAVRAGTVCYEILTRIGLRVERIYE